MSEKRLAQLDVELSRKYEYVAVRQDTINALYRELSHAATDTTRYAIVRGLFREYFVFNSDSALYYARLCHELAERAGDAERIADADIRAAHILTSTGDYMYAESIIEDIERRKPLEGLMLARFYELKSFNYQRQAEFLTPSASARRYRDKRMEVLDKLLDIYPEGSYNYYVTRAARSIETGVLDTAIYREIIANSDHFTFENRDAAVWAVLAGNMAGMAGDEAKQIELLCLSAIADIRSANREVTSLQLLAGIMLKRGDIERAYRYINSSTEDATIFNNRLRLMQITDLQDSIHAAYDNAIRSTQRSNLNTNEQPIRLVINSIVFVILICFIIYYARRVRLLSRSLAEANDKIAALRAAGQERGEKDTDSEGK